MKGGWQGEGKRAPALPPETQAALIARYQAGESYQPLARSVGISDRRMRALLHGVSVMRPRGDGRRGRAPAAPPARPRLLVLSPREREVLSEMATGKSEREIGDALCLSWKTIKTHRNHILQKLGVKNRVQAVLWWQEEQRKCETPGG